MYVNMISEPEESTLIVLPDALDEDRGLILRSSDEIKEFHILLAAWDGDGPDGAPSHSWPSTAEILEEIIAEVNRQHGGPLTTPELDDAIVSAEWSEIRAKIAAKKLAAAQAPPQAQDSPHVGKPRSSSIKSRRTAKRSR